MGRKGVSKRKPSKLKNLQVLKTKVETPTNAMHPSEYLVPRILDMGEALSISKDGKKKKKR